MSYIDNTSTFLSDPLKNQQLNNACEAGSIQEILMKSGYHPLTDEDLSNLKYLQDNFHTKQQILSFFLNSTTPLRGQTYTGTHLNNTPCYEDPDPTTAVNGYHNYSGNFTFTVPDRIYCISFTLTGHNSTVTFGGFTAAPGKVIDGSLSVEPYETHTGHCGNDGTCRIEWYIKD